MGNESKETKPLRKVADKMKDIMNTYGRQEPSAGTHDSGDSFESNAEATDTVSREIPIEENGKDHQEEATTAANESAAAPNSGLSKAEVEKLLAEKEELKEIAARKVAELENFRRRSEQEKKEIISYANRSLLEKLLPMIDDLGRAVENGKKTDSHASLLEGVEMIFKKTTSLLDEIGVKPIDAVGKPFDVKYHEALMQQPSEAEEGTILAEVVRGYTLHDKVIRHAKVITSAGQP